MVVVGKSTFNGVTFDWSYGEPTLTMESGVPVITGRIVCYSQSTFDSLFALQRPVQLQQCAGGAGNIYIDYFGTNPAHTLTMHGYSYTTTFLRKLEQQQKLPNPEGDLLFFANAEFVLTVYQGTAG